MSGYHPKERWAAHHPRTGHTPACPHSLNEMTTLFFFETKYILIENKIQNNSFQKTEIFNPFSTKSNLLHPQSTVLDAYMCTYDLFHKVFVKPLLQCRRWEQMMAGEKTLREPHLRINAHLEISHLAILSFDLSLQILVISLPQCVLAGERTVHRSAAMRRLFLSHHHCKSPGLSQTNPPTHF